MLTLSLDGTCSCKISSSKVQQFTSYRVNKKNSATMPKTILLLLPRAVTKKWSMLQNLVQNEKQLRNNWETPTGINDSNKRQSRYYKRKRLQLTIFKIFKHILYVTW